MRITVTPFVLPVGPQAAGELRGDAGLYARDALARLFDEATGLIVAPVRDLLKPLLETDSVPLYVVSHGRMGSDSGLYLSLGHGDFLTPDQLRSDVKALTRAITVQNACGIHLYDVALEGLGTPAIPSTFRAAPPPKLVFETRNWAALQRTVAAIVQLLQQLLKLLLSLLRSMPARLTEPPPQPAHTAPCAVARLQGTCVPRAPQARLSRFSLAS
jgi:hypothetical protein